MHKSRSPCPIAIIVLFITHHANKMLHGNKHGLLFIQFRNTELAVIIKHWHDYDLAGRIIFLPEKSGRKAELAYPLVRASVRFDSDTRCAASTG